MSLKQKVIDNYSRWLNGDDINSSELHVLRKEIEKKIRPSNGSDLRIKEFHRIVNKCEIGNSAIETECSDYNTLINGDGKDITFCNEIINNYKNLFLTEHPQYNHSDVSKY